MQQDSFHKLKSTPKFIKKFQPFYDTSHILYSQFDIINGFQLCGKDIFLVHDVVWSGNSFSFFAF